LYLSKRQKNQIMFGSNVDAVMLSVGILSIL